MSVLFWFEGDEKATETYECQCTMYDIPDPDCPTCKGIGKNTCTFDKHAVQFTNVNAAFCLKMMGISEDYPCGNATVDKFYKGVQRFHALMLFSSDDMKRRAKALGELTQAAKNTGATIINWG